MQERRERTSLPALTIVAVVAAVGSVGFWQWQRQQSPSDSLVETIGTVQSIEYVRSGQSASTPERSIKFDGTEGSYTLTLQDRDLEDGVHVGSKVALLYPSDSPSQALTPSQVISARNRQQTYASFSIIVGLIALLAGTASVLESRMRLTPTNAAQSQPFQRHGSFQ